MWKIYQDGKLSDIGRWLTRENIISGNTQHHYIPLDHFCAFMIKILLNYVIEKVQFCRHVSLFGATIN